MENLQYPFRSVPQVHVQGLEAQLFAVELRPASSARCLLMSLEGQLRRFQHLSKEEQRRLLDSGLVAPHIQRLYALSIGLSF